MRFLTSEVPLYSCSCRNHWQSATRTKCVDYKSKPTWPPCTPFCEGLASLAKRSEQNRVPHKMDEDSCTSPRSSTSPLQSTLRIVSLTLDVFQHVPDSEQSHSAPALRMGENLLCREPSDLPQEFGFQATSGTNQGNEKKSGFFNTLRVVVWCNPADLKGWKEAA